MWLNIQEIAQHSGASPSVVRAAIEKPGAEAVSTQPANPGHWMVHQDEVDRWVATRPESGRR